MTCVAETLLPQTSAFAHVKRERPKSSKQLQPLLENPANTMFLDIETTGLSKYYDYITVVGYEVAGEYHVLLPGQDDTHFRSALERSSSIVTFNGSGFDLPFLDATFETLPWPKHHVDLRYACRRLGYSGGQKAIEQQLHINCRSGIEDVDGAMKIDRYGFQPNEVRATVPALRGRIAQQQREIDELRKELELVKAQTNSIERRARLLPPPPYTQ